MRILKWLGNMTLWCAIAALAGNQIGYHQGYTRGVRDISTLLIVLHDAEANPPGEQTKRDIGWRQP